MHNDDYNAFKQFLKDHNCYDDFIVNVAEDSIVINESIEEDNLSWL
jgi:hypothetical protein